MSNGNGLIDRMCAAVDELDYDDKNGDEPFDKWPERWKDEKRKQMRAALAILAKPENVSDEMRDEACQAIFGFKPGNYDHQERVRKAIAASIQSILKTGQEKGPRA
jgi:cobalamin biosynthesis Mg chelatase CobN